MDCFVVLLLAMTKETRDSTPHIVIARAWKARGNLGMGYNYLFIEFFFFSVFVLTFYGLWIASSFYSSQWRRKITVIARVAFATHGNLVYSRLVIARLWKSCGNLGMGYNIIHRILLFCLFADNNFFLFSIFLFVISGLWIASLCSQWQYTHIVIARLRRRSENLVILDLSLRELLLQLVAISVILDLSLRELLATRGNP